MTISEVELGSVATVLNGFAFKSKEYVDDGIRIVRITNVQKGRIQDDDPKFIDASRENEFSRFMLGEGDLLISLTGNVGRVGVLDAALLPAALNQRVGALKIESADVDSRYLFHLLNSDIFERDAIKNSKGIAQLNLSSKWIEKYKIPLPPLPEQKRIAAILDAADALRAKRQESIKQLDALIQSTFIEMFIGETEYPQRKLEELCDLITDGTHQTPTYADEGVVFLSSKNVKSRRIDWDNVKYIPEQLHQQLHKRLAPRMNDILLAKNGTTGKAALVDRDGVFDVYVSLALLRPRQEINPVFLLHAVNSDFTYFQFKRSLKGVGVPNLHLKEIKKTTVPYPPVTVQEEFASIVQRSNIQRKKLVDHLAQLEFLFASLQSRAFAGEL